MQFDYNMIKYIRTKLITSNKNYTKTILLDKWI